MSNMVVRTNIYSLNAHRNMKNVGLQQKTAANRLSSGFRINSAADDAAGLAISETMRAQIRGLDQASRNAQDGQAMLLTTEGGLDEITNMLQRVRVLLNDAANDTKTQAQRQMIEQEISQLGQEIGSMQERVEFNTNQVLNIGNHSNVRTNIAAAQALFATAQHIMASAVRTHATLLGEQRMTLIAGTSVANSLHGESMSTAQINLSAALVSAASLAADGNQAAAAVRRDSALASFEAARAAADAVRTTSVAILNSSFIESMSAANITLQERRDTFSGSTQQFMITMQTQFSVISRDLDGIGNAWFQVGANSNQGIIFDFATVSQAVLVSGQLVDGIANALVSAGSSRQSGVGYGIDISPMIDAVDDGLSSINAVRANLGAVQNRMDYTMRSLDISSENLQDSESRVRNADIAKEMMNFTMSNVLQQAAVSMLSQANQMPQNLLQLLR